jgi:hypothetical protein
LVDIELEGSSGSRRRAGCSGNSKLWACCFSSLRYRWAPCPPGVGRARRHGASHHVQCQRHRDDASGHRRRFAGELPAPASALTDCGRRSARLRSATGPALDRMGIGPIVSTSKCHGLPQMTYSPRCEPGRSHAQCYCLTRAGRLRGTESVNQRRPESSPLKQQPWENP